MRYREITEAKTDSLVQRSLGPLTKRIIQVFLQDAKAAWRKNGNISWRSFKPRRLMHFLTVAEYSKFPQPIRMFLLGKQNMLVNWQPASPDASAHYTSERTLIGSRVSGITLFDRISESMKALLDQDETGNGRTEEVEMNYEDAYVRLHADVQHELTHAYDDWKSASNYVNPKKKQKFLNAVEKLKRLDSPETKDAVSKAYVNQPHEVNALFRDTVVTLPEPDTMPWKLYSSLFAAEFDRFNHLTPANHKRVMTRLARYWLLWNPTASTRPRTPQLPMAD